MAKSSIHIDSAKVNFLAHNTRSKKTVNSIFDDEENYYSCDFDSAVKLYREELAKRSAKYTERTGQKLQAKTVTMLSAVVNLNQHHDEHDLHKIVDHLEQTLDTKVINYAIHRDEGHRNDKGQPVKNYHAHIVFMGLDSEGRSVRKKLTKGYLSKLQDKTAQLLDMERGTNYAKQRKQRPKRLDTYEYKAAAEKMQRQRQRIVKRAREVIKKERDQTRAKIKDIDAENKRLREQLKEAGAVREQYAHLEALVKQLKEQARSKELTISELQERIKELESNLLRAEQAETQKDAQIANLSEKLKQEQEANEKLQTQNQSLTLANRKKDAQIGDLEAKIEDMTRNEDKKIEFFQSKHNDELTYVRDEAAEQVLASKRKLSKAYKLIKALIREIRSLRKEMQELINPKPKAKPSSNQRKEQRQPPRPVQRSKPPKRW